MRAAAAGLGSRADAPSTSRRDALVLGVAFIVLAAVAGVWLALDERPPEWDHANHLERAVACERDLGAGDIVRVLERSSFYPPLVPCLAGLAYRLVPSDVGAAQSVVVLFLGLGIAATYLLGRRLGGATVGLVAALVLGSAPFVLFSMLRFQLDLPLAAMVALTVFVALETEGFSRSGWSVAFGVLVGLGFVTKPPFGAYVLVPLVVVLLRVRTRRAAIHALIAAGLALALALPWYGLRLFGLASQFGSRSFRQAAEAGQPEALTWAGALFYPRWFVTQFGVVAVLLCLVGLVVCVRRRQWLVLATLLLPLALFGSIQNKNLRYTLPLLPFAAVMAGIGFESLRARARSVAGFALVVGAVVAVSSTMLGWPEPRALPWLGTSWAIASPPIHDDWKQREILRLIQRHAGGRAATVSIVPNVNFFSTSNFRYYALRDGLPLRVGRSWEGDPVAIDYMVLKTGDQGPSWTAGKSRRVGERFASDPALARAFPVIGEVPLPDGSTATVRARDIPPVEGVTSGTVARAIEAALRRRVDEFARDVTGLRVTIDHDSRILRGVVRRVELNAAVARVGELRRKNAATLRLTDVKLVVDDALVNPYSALGGGRLDLLDAGRLTIANGTVTDDDLAAFVRGLKEFRNTSVAIAGSAIAVSLRAPGVRVSGRVRVVPAAGHAFTLSTEDVRIWGVPVPSAVTGWIARNYDPAPGIAARLPFPVELGEVAIDAGTIRIGAVSREGAKR
jgi:dolichyl-phosphate-mannose-protein mannosyltransferase/glycosyl transferase family 22 (putative mannosyltransferase)